MNTMVDNLTVITETATRIGHAEPIEPLSAPNGVVKLSKQRTTTTRITCYVWVRMPHGEYYQSLGHVPAGQCIHWQRSKLIIRWRRGSDWTQGFDRSAKLNARTQAVPNGDNSQEQIVRCLVRSDRRLSKGEVISFLLPSSMMCEQMGKGSKLVAEMDTHSW